VVQRNFISARHPERLQAKYFHKFQNTFTLAQISSSRNLKEKPIGKYLRAAATGLILSLCVSSSLVTAIKYIQTDAEFRKPAAVGLF
jgi:hypothetical protein